MAHICHIDVVVKMQQSAIDVNESTGLIDVCAVLSNSVMRDISLSFSTTPGTAKGQNNGVCLFMNYCKQIQMIILVDYKGKSSLIILVPVQLIAFNKTTILKEMNHLQ